MRQDLVGRIFISLAISLGDRDVINSSAINAGINQSAALRVAALGIAVVAQPALAADASNGERVAVRWCAACHVVTSDQRHAYADAPPFKEIASRPNFSESGLVTFLLNPHAKMPNMSLTRIEAADIAAYIRTLR
jgi:mono/diheme cytochrome c family protein